MPAPLSVYHHFTSLSTQTTVHCKLSAALIPLSMCGLILTASDPQSCSRLLLSAHSSPIHLCRQCTSTIPLLRARIWILQHPGIKYLLEQCPEECEHKSCTYLRLFIKSRMTVQIPVVGIRAARKDTHELGLLEQVKSLERQEWIIYGCCNGQCWWCDSVIVLLWL